MKLSLLENCKYNQIKTKDNIDKIIGNKKRDLLRKKYKKCLFNNATN